MRTGRCGVGKTTKLWEGRVIVGIEEYRKLSCTEFTLMFIEPPMGA